MLLKFNISWCFYFDMYACVANYVGMRVGRVVCRYLKQNMGEICGSAAKSGWNSCSQRMAPN
jgi:hypothetical protein